MFRAEQALKMIDYVRETYGDELEFLWTKFPDNSVSTEEICRRIDESYKLAKK